MLQDVIPCSLVGVNKSAASPFRTVNLLAFISGLKSYTDKFYVDKMKQQTLTVHYDTLIVKSFLPWRSIQNDCEALVYIYVQGCTTRCHTLEDRHLKDLSREKLKYYMQSNLFLALDQVQNLSQKALFLNAITYRRNAVKQWYWHNSKLQGRYRWHENITFSVPTFRITCRTQSWNSPPTAVSVPSVTFATAPVIYTRYLPSFNLPWDITDP
jgi:hypothetical protein